MTIRLDCVRSIVTEIFGLAKGSNQPPLSYLCDALPIELSGQT
jgi:hypothetical protein